METGTAVSSARSSEENGHCPPRTHRGRRTLQSCLPYNLGFRSPTGEETSSKHSPEPKRNSGFLKSPNSLAVLPMSSNPVEYECGVWLRLLAFARTCVNGQGASASDRGLCDSIPAEHRLLPGGLAWLSSVPSTRLRAPARQGTERLGSPTPTLRQKHPPAHSKQNCRTSWEGDRGF